MKQNVTVSIDIELREKARLAGINLSKLLEFAIRTILEQGRLTKEDIQLEVLTQQKERLQEKIREYEGVLEQLRMRMKDLDEKIANLQEEIELREKSQQIAMLFRALNSIIVENNFDIEKSFEEARSIIAELNELGFEMDKKRFEKHVERLKLFIL